MKRKFNLFPVWQFEREAQYLTSMLQQGLKIIDTTTFVINFENFAPQSGIIRLDYQLNTDMDDYLHLTQANGWQLLTTLPALNGRWLYLYNADSQAQLYSDNYSKIDLLIRLRRRWTLIALAAILFSSYMAILGDSVSFASWPIGLIFMLYLINFLAFSRQIYVLKLAL
ncbi:DUF2812 domain-containing protein [Lactiplantibacillus mudanjiangensis]|uniref:DUF2812 domain-containing protein n=1 Tax=Lactiplantibacillus mudanjiangensis TaxID=1296538 RepID=A0A660E4A8_9LACO|nr:DUF2812 domain-containing protein [Lactiplantibacillus mudanjiangensis]VDG20466.1 hypothetical protein [Lactobacillus paracollinoides] [Lactiplantibacillus mudanjiangensis]VDG24308.1 hypothetical protein [Lactobacillus paracollinoides] [Lactiplantibacillus mudanjiangensis]VDG30430.1 hypothetical protein [Lactobacillus paracollinoides] [Lactiplantibacillus mudanjiangensis]